MKKLYTLLFILVSFVSLAQVTKTSGVLYTSGNPKTNKVGSLIRKSLSKNSEIVVDQSTGDLYTYKRADSTFNSVGKTLVDITRPEFMVLKNSNSLVPGTIYKVSGCHKNSSFTILYDDGTDSGTTLYLTALTTNTIANSGYGEFYNPKYRIDATASEYNNTDGTGLWGIWDGDNPDGSSQTYTTDQVVYWGGYAWKNLTDSVGTADDPFTLDSINWVKLPYTDTSAYNKVIDYIEYDIDNDWVVRRKDEVANIDVSWVLRSMYIDDYNWVNFRSPIAAMQWGLYLPSEETTFNQNWSGTHNVKVSNWSYYFCANFKGKSNFNNHLENLCFVYNNYVGIGCILSSNILTNNSVIYDNILKENSDISLNTLSCFSNIYSNTLENGSSIYGNILTKSCNIFFNDYITGQISSNILTIESDISECISIATGSIKSNVLIGSSIRSFTSTSNAQVTGNTLSFSLFSLAVSGALTTKAINRCTIINTTFTADISSATNIFGNYSKEIFTRADGTQRLKYYNTSDTPTIVNVNN